MNTLTFLEASKADIDTILLMMEDFYAIDKYAFNKEVSRKNVEIFIQNSNYGKLWIIKQQEIIIGYTVLALGFSFEYGGVTAFIDELYLIPDYRNKGLGKMILEFVLNRAREMGIQSVHL